MKNKMGLSDQDLILSIVLPIFGVFLLFLIVYFIYYCKCCSKRKRNLSEETELLLTSDRSNYLDQKISNNSDHPETTSFMKKNDKNLIEKVKLEKLKQIADSRDTAFVFLQFFMRSNPNRIFKSVEHLPQIGAQVDRNWFLIKETTREKMVDKSKHKMLLIDKFDPKPNRKTPSLLQIAESMSLSRRQMETLIRDFFKTIQHPNVLSSEVHLSFDKKRVLILQDFSRDGSLKDIMHGSNPKDEWNFKIHKTAKTLFYIMTLKNFGRQILSGLIYLKSKNIPPVHNLHSGNIILAFNKQFCLITGYENCLFTDKSYKNELNEKTMKKILKIYLVKSNENGKIITRKAKNEIEMKKILEILRFGYLIVEMCTGVLIDDLVPSSDVLKLVENYQKSNNNSGELLALIHFIFFNKSEDAVKSKKKYIIPELEEVFMHNFFNDVLFSEESLFANHQIDPVHLEVMKYLNGSLKIKEKKQKKLIDENKDCYFPLNSLSVTSSKNSMQNSNFVPTNTFTPAELQPDISMIRDHQKTLSLPSPPPPPPPPPLSPPPPPPPSNPVSTSNRSALLDSIRTGTNLKKATTNDRSKPII
jgi:hypothetical protein